MKLLLSFLLILPHLALAQSPIKYIKCYGSGYRYTADVVAILSPESTIVKVRIDDEYGEPWWYLDSDPKFTQLNSAPNETIIDFRAKEKLSGIEVQGKLRVGLGRSINIGKNSFELRSCE